MNCHSVRLISIDWLVGANLLKIKMSFVYVSDYNNLYLFFVLNLNGNIIKKH